MAKESSIQWTDATVNFWTGCVKVSDACKYCYMYRGMERWGKDPTLIRRTNKSTFSAATKWTEPRRIFTCSYSDFFIEQADAWRNDAWDVIRATPQHTWLILTKRPERILQCLPADWGESWSNVWLGVTVENQSTLHRAVTLTSVPARIRFISAEPMLGSIDFLSSGVLQNIDWMIVGGESGNKTGKYRYRNCEAVWIQQLITQSQQAGVKVFIKQAGNFLARQLGMKDRFGGKWEEFPAWMQHREFPLEN